MSNFGRFGLALPDINLCGGWFGTKRLYDVLPDRVVALVDAAGFDEFMCHPAMAMDQSYVLAMLERYRPETFSFHFRWSEMIVLPSHIALLTGLQVRGLLVHYDPRMSNAMVEELVGEVIPWGPNMGARVSLTQLESQFFPARVRRSYGVARGSFLGPNGIRAHQLACAFILFMSGRTVFDDPSGGQVGMGLLSLMRNLETVREYSWGTAADVTLFHEMGCVVTNKVRSFGGFWPLLSFTSNTAENAAARCPTLRLKPSGPSTHERGESSSAVGASSTVAQEGPSTSTTTLAVDDSDRFSYPAGQPSYTFGIDELFAPGGLADIPLESPQAGEFHADLVGWAECGCRNSHAFCPSK